MAPTRRCQSRLARGRARRSGWTWISVRPVPGGGIVVKPAVDVAEPRADDEQRVRLAEPRRERRVLSEPEVACVAPRLVVDIVLTAPCCRDGDGARLEPLPETFSCAARPRLPTDDRERPLRHREQPAKLRGSCSPGLACAGAYGDASATSARSSVSSGTASTTGPDAPTWRRKARATSSGSRAASSTCATHFVSRRPARSRAPGTPPGRRRPVGSGRRRGSPACRPGRPCARRPTPGSRRGRVARSRSWRPVSFPYASAMFAAPASWRQVTKRIGLSRSASRISR